MCISDDHCLMDGVAYHMALRNGLDLTQLPILFTVLLLHIVLHMYTYSCYHACVLLFLYVSLVTYL